MHLDSLQAISPIDGRYWSQAEALVPYFSEEALIRYRVRIEILYFIALSEELPALSKVLNEERIEHLHDIYLSFSTYQGDRAYDEPRRQGRGVLHQGAVRCSRAYR